LAEQSGVQFVYSAEMVKGLDSPGVSGNYSLSAALTHLLAGSGLGYQLGKGNTVTLQKMLIPVAATKPAQPAFSTVLPTVKVTGSAANDDPNDPYNQDYKIANSMSATKTDTPIMETPVSIQVVPKSVMSDQKPPPLKMRWKTSAVCVRNRR
jgi:Secretin and TonB N terminus short domain.